MRGCTGEEGVPAGPQQRSSHQLCYLGSCSAPASAGTDQAKHSGIPLCVAAGSAPMHRDCLALRNESPHWVALQQEQQQQQ